MQKVGSEANSVKPPHWVNAEITFRCPLHCVYCYNPVDYTRSGPELTTDEWLRVLRQAREVGAVQLGISGGEPLMRDDLEIMIAEARRMGYFTTLLTSGVGLTEKRIAAFKEGGLDAIQLSFQDSTRELNDFLSSTRTFELKSKVAKLVKQYDYPMVLNVVLHRLNIDHIQAILDMAEAMGVEQLELANTQYYAWAMLNRDQLLPTREQLRRAEEITNQFRARVGNKIKAYFVVPGLLRDTPEGMHVRMGLGVPQCRCRRCGTALPRGTHAARAHLPQRARARCALDLVRVGGLQRVPWRCVDERAVPQLPGKEQGLRRLPLPGLHAHR